MMLESCVNIHSEDGQKPYHLNEIEMKFNGELSTFLSKP